MIPQIIHYCWFGRNPLPESAIKCIESWKKYLPEYEIKEWNEDNFDVNMIPYTADAYTAKKYAFVSDYARFWILYKYGGLYFDTDVEVIKPLDNIINNGPFWGCESDASRFKNLTVAAGLGMGALPRMDIYQSIIRKYETLTFLTGKGSISQQTVVSIVTSLLFSNGLENTAGIQKCMGVTIYPKEYFCPLDYTTGKLSITPNTYSIHHYAATWLPWYEIWEAKFWKFLGLRRHYVIRKVLTKFGFA